MSRVAVPAGWQPVSSPTGSLPRTRSPCSNTCWLHPAYLFSLQFLPWEICSFLASPSTSFVNSRYHTRFALSNVDFLLTERPAQSGGTLVLLPSFLSPANLPPGNLAFLTLSPADFVISPACLSTPAHVSSQHGEATGVGTWECEDRPWLQAHPWWVTGMLVGKAPSSVPFLVSLVVSTVWQHGCLQTHLQTYAS